jgi:hypothetical protein
MEIQGQITPSSERGRILKKIIEDYKPKNIVEIGTWKGMGSTLCIVQNLNYNSNFISIESNKVFYEIAQKNLSDYSNKVKLEYGKIIENNEIEDFIKNVDLNNEQKKWLFDDLENFNRCPNILNKIPKEIDFLLLDGGEFSTYSEWHNLKNRVKIVALDDINVLKCELIVKELNNDSDYEIIDNTNEGYGFCVFIKK